MSTPPVRLETDRLVIRRWDPKDVHAVKATIDRNIAHLLPWMPWVANEPESVAEKTARLIEFRRLFDAGEDSIYGIWDRSESQVLGGTGLHPRSGAQSREIGYWIDAAHEGQGLITEATAVLTRVGFEHLDLDRIEIHCDPLNTRSAAVPLRLGYVHEATLRRRLTDHEGNLRDEMIWTLFRDGYPDSPATAFAYSATP